MSNKLSSNNISILFLIFILCIIVLFPITKTGFTTTDDIYTELFPTVHDAAFEQGRVGFLLLSYPSKLPYLLDSEVYFEICRVGSIILTLVLFFICIYVLFDSYIIAILSAIFFLSFIQNSWDHNPITSYPATHQFIVQCLFVSLIFFKKAIAKGKLTFSIISAIFYFLALSYEAIFFYFPIFLMILLQKYNHKEKISNAIRNKDIGREISPIIIALFLYLSLYTCWRYFHPSEYAGNVFGLNDPFSFIKTVFQYSISSLPGYYFFNQSASQISYGFEQAFSFSHFLSQLRVEWIVKTCVVFWVTMMILHRITKEAFNKNFLVCAFLSCFSAIFLPNILLGTTAKYQNWVLLHGSKGYTTTYLSFFGTVAALALLVTYMMSWVSNKYTRAVLVVVFAIITSFISLITDYHNFFVFHDQQLTDMKWKVMDRFIETKTFQSIPAGSLIYSPTLFEGRGIVGIYPDYWTSYIQKKTGKNIHITNRISENRIQKKEKIFFLKFKQEPHTENHATIFGKMVDNDLQLVGLPCGYAATIFSYSTNKKLNVIGFTLCEYSGEGNTWINGMPAKNRGGAFFGKLDLSKEQTDFPKVNITSDHLIRLNEIFITYHKNDEFMQNLFFKKGWSYDEVSFRWATAKTAFIGILTPKKLTQSGSVEFTLYSLKTRNIKIFFNSVLIKDVMLDPNKPTQVTLNGLFFKPCGVINTLRFETNVPPEHPENKDPRKLSFSIADIKCRFDNEKGWYSERAK